MITINDNDFNKLVDYVKSNFGILLKNKKSLIEGRLSNLLYENGCDNFNHFLEDTYNDRTGQKVKILVDKLTTNYTFFMREPVHFNFYSDKILPKLTKDLKDRDLRVWSAGCSSGQEPYTIAMINHDFFGNQKLLWDTKILATDISTTALEKAKSGNYTTEEVSDLSKLQKLNYFKPYEDSYMISDKIKNDVIFRKFNLMDDVFPFKKKFHVIFCRNVMIYFDTDTREELVRKLYECTAPGGYLFISHSESINKATTKYKYIMPAVYQKE